MLRGGVRLLATLMLSVIVVAAVAWAAMAIWFDGPHSRVIAVSSDRRRTMVDGDPSEQRA
jgi:hypothetical protein